VLQGVLDTVIAMLAVNDNDVKWLRGMCDGSEIVFLLGLEGDVGVWGHSGKHNLVPRRIVVHGYNRTDALGPPKGGITTTPLENCEFAAVEPIEEINRWICKPGNWGVMRVHGSGSQQ
jgi:hypothetical protein